MSDRGLSHAGPGRRTLDDDVAASRQRVGLSAASAPHDNALRAVRVGLAERNVVRHVWDGVRVIVNLDLVQRTVLRGAERRLVAGHREWVYGERQCHVAATAVEGVNVGEVELVIGLR